MTTELSTDERAELERLRSRVAELEASHIEQIARANAAVADAQERAYWLDRWGLDLNAAMATRGGRLFRGTMRTARAVVRGAQRLRRRLRRT